MNILPMEVRKMNSKSSKIFIFLFLLLTACQEEPAKQGKQLGELSSISEHQIQREIDFYKSIENPNAEDRHNIAYSLVAFSLTTPRVSEANGDKKVDNSGGGVIRSTGKFVGNVTREAKQLNRLKKRLAPMKENAAKNGLKIWHNLALENHLQAIIGLAYYYGKTEDYQNAYFYRRLAFLRGDEPSNFWASEYSNQLPADKLMALETRIKEKTGDSYLPTE